MPSVSDIEQLLTSSDRRLFRNMQKCEHCLSRLLPPRKDFEPRIMTVYCLFVTACYIDALLLYVVTGQPEHLSVLLSDYTPSRQLWSSDRQLLSQPADNTVFASRAFSSSAPRIWNSLPITVRSAPSSNTFRRHLKTHLFSNNTAIE